MTCMPWEILHTSCTGTTRCWVLHSIYSPPFLGLHHGPWLLQLPRPSVPEETWPVSRNATQRNGQRLSRLLCSEDEQVEQASKTGTSSRNVSRRLLLIAVQHRAVCCTCDQQLISQRLPLSRGMLDVCALGQQTRDGFRRDGSQAAGYYHPSRTV